jgi:hypothetical protein
MAIRPAKFDELCSLQKDKKRELVRAMGLTPLDVSFLEPVKERSDGTCAIVVSVSQGLAKFVPKSVRMTLRGIHYIVFLEVKEGIVSVLENKITKGERNAGTRKK